jgi:hypothetical protein
LRPGNGLIRSMSRKNWDSIEGIVDVGPIVIAHCNNPAKKPMIAFLQKVLTGKIPALIPVTTFFGAYHILTKYLKVTRQDALLSLEETLNVDSPAFYEGITREEARTSLKLSSINNIESWDGYLINIGRQAGTHVIYTIDTKLEREGFKAVVPITVAELAAYHDWVEKIVKKRS